MVVLRQPAKIWELRSAEFPEQTFCKAIITIGRFCKKPVEFIESAWPYTLREGIGQKGFSASAYCLQTSPTFYFFDIEVFWIQWLRFEQFETGRSIVFQRKRG